MFIKRTIELMMLLLRSEITGAALNSSPFTSLSNEDWSLLYDLAKKHDLAHLAGDAAIRNQLLTEGEIKTKFEKQLMIAFYRYQTMQYELDRIRQVLNQGEIAFIPLKGSVIRRFYPQPWMRTSCDIDILIHESDLPKTADLLQRSGYSRNGQSSYDVSFMTASGVHIELHFTLIEKDMLKDADRLLLSVWDYAEPISGTYEYVLNDEMYYYYHIAHMAKHLEGGGGCGIRPFIDLWILNYRVAGSKEKRDNLLSAGGLDRFAKVSSELADCWMNDREPSSVGAQLEEFVLSGGVYGKSGNRILFGNAKQKSKWRYLLSRIWIPYDHLIGLYPSLKGKRILLPFYEIRRWFRLFRSESFKRSYAEFKAGSQISDEARDQAREMLSELGLM